MGAADLDLDLKTAYVVSSWWLAECREHRKGLSESATVGDLMTEEKLEVVLLGAGRVGRVLSWTQHQQATW